MLLPDCLQEKPQPNEIGACLNVKITEIGSARCAVFSHAEGDASGVATIVARGSTQNILDDVERSIDDGVNVVKAMARDGRFVAGAGACEMRLAHVISEFGASKPGLDQYAVNKFATALEVIPRTLAQNGGLDDNIVAELKAAHATGNVSAGIDVVNHNVCNDVGAKGILDLLETKRTALKLATEAAVTVLRVDQIIMAKPAGGPKPPEQGGMPGM